MPGRPAVSRLKALPTCLFDPFRVGIALRIANRGHCPRLLQWLPFGQDSKARRDCHAPALAGRAIASKATRLSVGRNQSLSLARNMRA